MTTKYYMFLLSIHTCIENYNEPWPIWQWLVRPETKLDNLFLICICIGWRVMSHDKLQKTLRIIMSWVILKIVSKACNKIGWLFLVRICIWPRAMSHDELQKLLSWWLRTLHDLLIGVFIFLILDKTVDF